MSESRSLSKNQEVVLDCNTAIATLTGLAIRYHSVLDHDAAMLDGMAAVPDEPAAPTFRERAELTREVISTKAQIGFSLSPSNMAMSIRAMKVDPQTRQEIPHSNVEIGLVGGFAEDGKPSRGFAPEDVTFAIDRLKAQEEVGITYGLDSNHI